MTPIEDIITRNTDAILNALQARFEARPLDPELQALFREAVHLVELVFPINTEQASALERAEYVAGVQARLDSLQGLFRNATPARALRNLVICLHCVDRLLEAQWLDAEQADAMKGQVLGHYAVYAPVEPLQ
jgi:hypothetical protein